VVRVGELGRMGESGRGGRGKGRKGEKFVVGWQNEGGIVQQRRGG